MAPQLDDAQRILINDLLTQGFDTHLIASNVSCTVRTVQRIRRERQQSNMPAGEEEEEEEERAGTADSSGPVLAVLATAFSVPPRYKGNLAKAHKSQASPAFLKKVN